MVQVTHVRHQEGGSGDRHITSVRWYYPADGQVSDTAVAGMVEFLRKPGARAYVCDGSRIVDVKVVDAQPPYLRTVADGLTSDNLSKLPKF